MKERMRSKFLVYAAVLCGGLFLFMSGQVSAATIVKFKLLRGHVIVIPITVNGSGPYDFILDTGASTTTVSSEFARVSRLRPADRVELVTVAGSRFLPRAYLSSVSIGAKSVENLEAIINDLTEARAISSGIHGALGQNFLSQFNILIDYRERQIECVCH